MERLIRRIETRTDAGAKVTVNEFGDFIEIETKDGREFIGSKARLALANGDAVNVVDERTFEIARTGERLNVT